MANEPYPQGPYAPAVPPTTPGALPQMVPLSKWPKVLGIIAIIWGAIGALGAAWGLIGMNVMSGFMRNAPPQVLAQMERMRGWMITANAVNLPLALLLLLAGIGLCNRRRWGVATARTWAVLNMLLGTFSMAIGWHLQQVSFQSNPTLAGGGGFVRVIQVVGLVFGLAAGWAPPVFTLIWLSRAKIKAETATWQ